MPRFRFLRALYHFLTPWIGSAYYGLPSRSLKVIGVTGTKGKSTVVYLITKFLEEAGIPAACIGSLGYTIDGREFPNATGNTMPGRFRLQKFLRDARDAGAKAAILEVTSEGIAQWRDAGIRFYGAVFTNLEPEHIERHGSFSNYYRAKQKLFRKTKRFHALNADSGHVDLFSGFPAEKKVFYGINKGGLRAEDIELGRNGTRFKIQGRPLSTRLLGEHNVYNILAAYAAAEELGASHEAITRALLKIENIPGRLEEIHLPQCQTGKCAHPFRVFVDYAHTPNALKAVYSVFPKGRIIGVLGAAGGGRDRWKRPEFGKIAARACREVILTNEDPFDEDPERILDDIQEGIEAAYLAHHVHRITDRKAAIAKALELAESDDVIVITGKGSEGAIRVARGRQVPWSDREVARELLCSYNEGIRNDRHSPAGN